jgi:hypothetical protein
MKLILATKSSGRILPTDSIVEELPAYLSPLFVRGPDASSNPIEPGSLFLDESESALIGSCGSI